MISTTILISPSLMLMISISLPIPLLQVLITFSYWSLNCVCAFLGTHDIQSITIISDGSSNGTVCIQCNYINGADSTGCIVSLSNTNITVYNILYNNEYGCVEVIAGFYSMYIFEVNNDGTIVEVENIVPDTITIEFSILSTTSYITNSIIPTMPSKFNLVVYYKSYSLAVNTNGELLYIVLPIVALLGLTILVIIGGKYIYLYMYVQLIKS